MEPIPQTRQYNSRLRTFVESPDELDTHGHVTQPLTDDQLLLKKRCSRCSMTLAQINKEQARLAIQQKVHERKNFKPAQDDALSTPAANQPEENGKKNTHLCRFHPGRVVDKYWTCCSEHVSKKPCGGAESHNLLHQSLDDLSTRYQFHATPPYQSHRGDAMRAAVALDCEMGTAQSGDTELIRISIIDYFSGEILVNSLVQPSVRMAHLNTKYSGVTFLDLNNARRAGKVLWGTAGARSAIWKHIGPETVVVGHGVSNDLRALKWLHTNVVDSYIIGYKKMKKEEQEQKAQEEAEQRALEDKKKAREALGLPAVVEEVGRYNAGHLEGQVKEERKKAKGSGRLSLKTMTKEYLGKEIQTGTRGHDSLEDAVAARDLVHWLITHPERA